MTEEIRVLFIDDSSAKMESYAQGLRLRGGDVTIRVSVDKAHGACQQL